MTIKINGTNTTAQPSITGADTDTGLVYGTDQVQVVTGGTTRATVDSSGRVGIGTAAPASLLDVHTTTEGNVARFRASDDVRYLQISSFNAGANGSGYDFDATSSSGALSFSTTGSERLRIQSGGGISFNGDTAAANALDDYEEGTWTPTVTLGTVSAFNGKYTKIGNIVNLSGELNNFSDRSTSSALRISSLPFNNLNPQAAGSMFGRYMDRTAYTSYVHQNTIWFYSIGSGNFTELQHQHLNNSGATIYFQATYTVS